MHRWALLFILGALLVGAPSWAQSWRPSCQTGAVDTSVSPGGFACFDPTANTDDSPILSVVGCDYTNWEYFEDKDGDGTDCAVTFTIQTCPDPTLTGSAADNGCEDVEIPSGSPTLSNTNRQQAGIAVGGMGLRAEAGDSGANAGDCRIVVSCASGTGGL